MTGSVNNAIQITDAGNESTTVSLTDEFDNLTLLTIAFRMKYLDVPASGQTIIEVRDSGAGKITLRMQLNTVNFRFSFNDDIGGGINSVNLPLNTVDFDTDQIYHTWIITWDGTNVRIYDDNVLLVTSGDLSSTLLWSTPDLLRVGHTGNTDFDIDDVEFHDTVFTTIERRNYQRRTGIDEVEISGVDYSANLIDWIFEDANNFFASEFDLVLEDETGSIKTAISRYNKVEIYESGTRRFNGVITDIKPSKGDSSIIEIVGLNYWTFLLREPIFRAGANAFVNKSASEIIADIVATELAGINLSTADSSKFVPTTTIIFNDATETKMNYRGKQSAGDIFLDLAFREDYIVYIDDNKDLTFRPNIAVDSGVHLNYDDGDIIDDDIVQLGGDIVNVVNVEGAPGQPPNTDPVGAIVEDMASIAKLATDEWDGRLPIITISRTELATPEACQIAGDFEIKKRNQDPDRGPVRTEFNFDVKANELITLTIPAKNITAQSFIIQRIKHSLNENTTIYDVVYYTRETADLVQLILEQNRRTELFLVDDALIFTKFVKLQEEIILTATVDVQSRTFAGAEYGEFNYGTKNYGTVSGAFTSDVSAKQITVQNKLFENWLRIIGQIATVPNKLNAANSFIAIGSNSTAIQVTDTTLAGENFRKPMQPGYPNQGTDLKLIFKSILGDSDAITTTIRNLALFDASSSGNMLLAGVLASDLSKVADQEWDFTVTLTQASVSGFLTTVGGNLLRDLLSLVSTDFLDNSNVAIEIITSPVNRDGMDSGRPKFTTVGSDQLLFEVTIDTTTLATKSFAGVDLYNMLAAGVQVIDGALGVTTTIVDGQNMKVQVLIKMRR